MIVGKDLVVRGAVIQVSRSGKPSVLLRQLLQLFCLLEVQSQTKNTLSDVDVKFVGDTEVDKFIADSKKGFQQPDVVPRKRRAAAVHGELRRRLNPISTGLFCLVVALGGGVFSTPLP